MGIQFCWQMTHTEDRNMSSPYGRRSIEADLSSYKKQARFHIPLAVFRIKSAPHSLHPLFPPMKLMRVGRRDPCRDNGGNADCLVICRWRDGNLVTFHCIHRLSFNRGYPSPVLVSFDVPYKHFTQSPFNFGPLL